MGPGELTIFQQLCIKMVEDPGFAEKVLHGTPQEQRDELDAFLTAVGFEGDREKAIHDLIVAITRADLGAIKDLQETLDLVTPQIAI